jgi:hypothetical protein
VIDHEILSTIVLTVNTALACYIEEYSSKIMVYSCFSMPLSRLSVSDRKLSAFIHFELQNLLNILGH